MRLEPVKPVFNSDVDNIYPRFHAMKKPGNDEYCTQTREVVLGLLFFFVTNRNHDAYKGQFDQTLVETTTFLWSFLMCGLAFRHNVYISLPNAKHMNKVLFLYLVTCCPRAKISISVFDISIFSARGTTNGVESQRMAPKIGVVNALGQLFE